VKVGQFKEIEKSLEQRIKNRQEKTVCLQGDDFKDGKLSLPGYNRIKQECEYISYKEEIEIEVSEEFEKNFKETQKRKNNQ
jgi:hypothetical protein